MVIICDKTFTEEKYTDIFQRTASFELSNFQKWAIKGIVEGDNVLITAHTGSGKTLPAEFMIEHLIRYAESENREKKKVIYASPIKALSNQKLHDMRKKYPDISIGLLTGDVKDNPEADVLIMTTEILRNTLFNKQIAETTGTQMPLSFNIDIEKELGGVVFDEVHYINDEHRGSVWEQSILLLPPHVQILMLSATIDSPEKFADWVEKEKSKQSISKNIPEKKMILAPTYNRVVPLTHNMWISAHQSIFKKVKNTEYNRPFKEYTNKLVPIKTPDGNFHLDNFNGVTKIKNYFWDNNVYVKRYYVLNGIVKYLKENKMLPAICFVFSRRHVELAAKEIQTCLFNDDETQPNTVEKECKKILMSKFTNYKEYLGLPEFNEVVSLLKKGVAIHHAGMLPVLREMIELLFDRGYVKLLFATETFSVGINMPTKTVLFSSLQKWDGKGKRDLLPHEYTQMAGRAGRRGLDKIGHVIHCNNLFDCGYAHEYKKILCGVPQRLVSKFKINYSVVLNVIASGAGDLTKVETFVKQSLISREIEKESKSLAFSYSEKESELLSLEKSLSFSKTPIDTIKEYVELSSIVFNQSRKQKKKSMRQLDNLRQTYKTIEKEANILEKIKDTKKEMEKIRTYEHNTQSYIATEVDVIANILQECGFIEKDAEDNYILLEKGKVASQLQEVHILACSDMLLKCNYFENMTPQEIVCILSMFTNIRVSDEKKSSVPIDNVNAFEACSYIKQQIDYYCNIELKNKINSGENCDFNFDIMDTIIQWYNASDENTCKQIVQTLSRDKEIFIGDFIKAILKINNIVAEMEKIAEMNNNIPLLEKIRLIPTNTLKYVATNQSLYI